MGNLFQKITEVNFPKLVMEIDMQIQEAQSPKQDRYKETSQGFQTPKHPSI